jgi:ketosteroid isomerase-like protein
LGTEGGVTLESFSVDVVELQGVGDLAYARATYQFEISMTVDDEEITVQNQGPYMNILRPNEAGDWRIYRQIINRDHPPASPD